MLVLSHWLTALSVCTGLYMSLLHCPEPGYRLVSVYVQLILVNISLSKDHGYADTNHSTIKLLEAASGLKSLQENLGLFAMANITVIFCIY